MATTSTTSASDAAAALLAHEDNREALDDDPPPVRKRQKTTRRTYARSSPLKQETQERECNDNADDTPAASTFSKIPPLQKEVPETVFSSSGDNEAGLRLIDISSLKHGLQHLCCCECSEKKMDARMLSFLKFHNAKVANAKLCRKKHPTVEDSYEAFLKLDSIKSSKTCSNCLVSVELESETKGFATTLHFKCKETSELKGHSVFIVPQKVFPSFFSGKKD